MRPPAVQEYFEKIARKGGKARALKLSKEERQTIARAGADARWKKAKQKKA